MEELIIFQYPAWLVILCILLGLAYAWLFYRKNTFRKDGKITGFPTIFMFSFRTVSVFLIALLLLAPLLRSITRAVEEPVIAFLVDDSRSVVLNQDSAFYKNDFPSLLNETATSLRQDGKEVSFYSFATDVERTEEWHFNREGTNISKALEDINDRYFGRNLGAIVLASDGIYNQGRNPLFTARNINTPIYTVGIGDTIPPRDLLIADVLHNRIVYAGNQFQVRTRINALGYGGEDATLRVMHNDTLVKEQDFHIDADEFYHDIDLYLEAEEAGLKRYEFHVTEMEGEINYENNSRQSIVEVLESRRKVLLIAASPHPDVLAIRQAIERQERFEATYLPYSAYLDDTEGWNNQFEDYQMILLHRLPGQNLDNDPLMSQLNNITIPLFFILGSSTDFSTLHAFGPGFRATNASAGASEMLPTYTGSFTYFHFTETGRELLDDFPPLNSPVLSFDFEDEHEILIESRQRRRGATEPAPLMFFVNKQEQPVGVLNGEGMWRWFMYNFRQHGDQHVLDDMWFQTARFLSAERQRERFNVYISDKVFNENERIEITAEFYNEAFQPVLDADVFLEVTDEEDQVYDFSFRSVDEHYVVDAGRLTPGNYSFRAFTEYGNESFEATGAFAVEPLDLESLDLVARFDLLRNMARETGGNDYEARNADNIRADILENDNIVTVSQRDYDFSPLIHQKWLFFTIIMFVSFEWFMRKFFGSF